MKSCEILLKNPEETTETLDFGWWLLNQKGLTGDVEDFPYQQCLDSCLALGNFNSNLVYFGELVAWAVFSSDGDNGLVGGWCGYEIGKIHQSNWNSVD